MTTEPQTTDTFTDAQGRRYVAGCEVPEVVWQQVQHLAAEVDFWDHFHDEAFPDEPFLLGAMRGEADRLRRTR